MIREGKRGAYVVAVENAYAYEGYLLGSSREALAMRREESRRGSKILGAARVEWLLFKSYYLSTNEPFSRIYPTFESLESLQNEMKDAILDGLPPVLNADRQPVCVERFHKLIDDYDPDVVFVHSPDDGHVDHYCVARFVSQFPPSRLKDYAAIHAQAYGSFVGVQYAEAFYHSTCRMGKWDSPDFIESLKRDKIYNTHLI